MSSYPAYYEKYKVMDNPDSTPQEQSEESPSPKRQKGGNFPLKRTFSNRDTSNGIKVEESPSSEQNGGKFSPKKAAFSNYVNKSGIKEWRLVVRNLPFSTKKEDVEKFFSKLGNVKEVTLPPNKDKRFPKSCAGFCFVQYASRNAADQAISTLNFTDFMGRKIAVDWALDKDSYITKVVESKPPKQPLEIKPSQNPKASKKAVKKELKEEENEDLSSEESENENDSDEETSVDEEQESVNSPPAKKGKFPDKNQAKQRPGDLAVQEGRAIFIRNLGFDVTNEEISKEFSKFGEIALAITCKFPHTDHPTGTAFVHFKEKEAADKCLDQLNSIDGIIVEDRKVYGYRAVSREDASVFKKSQEKHPKDKRNLKLLRVSLIRPGTSQANNMSEFDATKRQKLATSAKIKLKNLHMFVSPTRLVVHNVPPSMKEQKLREICFLAADHVDGKITECRIMRERKDKSPDGKLILGKSKGFAFVEFAEHNDALKCLQAINNNPTLFSDQKRPIVEFSIENMQALKIKERRVNKPVTPNAKDLADLEQTKSQITAQKPLPKKFGVKIRHRDSKKGQSSQGNQKKKDKMKGKNKNVYINKGQKKKKAKKSRE